MHVAREGGSGIHIKPSHKGKFTAYAKSKGKSVQGAAAAVLKSKEASPALKKEANFARNAKQFKH